MKKSIYTYMQFDLVLIYMVGQLPNVLGFLFGVAQMILYVMYKKPSGGKKDDKEAVKNIIPIKTTSIDDEQKINTEEWTKQVKDNQEKNDMMPV